MASSRPHRAAVYVRVSTHDQEVENQLGELRRFVEVRGWSATEFSRSSSTGMSTPPTRCWRLLR